MILPAGIGRDGMKRPAMLPQWILDDLTEASDRHRHALYTLHWTIAFCEEVNPNTAAALQFAIQQVHDAGEVYDMALLELIEHWRTTTPFTRLNQKLFL